MRTIVLSFAAAALSFGADEWPRHVAAAGYHAQTAMAADFSSDGPLEIIANDIEKKQTWLYRAPAWKPVLLHEGVAVIHSAVDMDNDGDLDVLIAGQESRNVVWYENRIRR